jgi:phosphoribosyl 1,2-cyclic phosphate phosphodiesterase
MKITILGSGSAYGVPVIGGHWGDCDPREPKNRRLAPSILIEDKGKRILVDMGPDIRPQAERFDITKLDAIVYTHPHADHITGNFHLPMLMRYFEGRNLPMFATRATRKDIEKVWWFQNDPAIKMQWYGPGRPTWHEIIAGYKFDAAGVEILPLTQFHGSMESVGLRIGNFAYSTDVGDMPEETFKALEGLDVWVVECDSVHPTKSHSHIEKTLEWIARVKPKKAWLTHMDSTMDYAKVLARMPAGVEPAFDGLEITL